MPTKYQLHPVDLLTETVGDRTDSLRQISWSYIGISEDNQQVSEFHHCTHLSSENTPDSEYVEFSDLQANTVMAWIENDLDNTIATDYESDLTLRQYAQQEIERCLVEERDNTHINHQMPWYSTPLNPESTNEETPE
jgi:hypothetical protein